MERYMLPLVLLLLFCGCAQKPAENENDTAATTQTVEETTTTEQASTTIIATTQATTLSTTSAAPTTSSSTIPNVEKNKWVPEEGVRLEDAFSPAVIKLDSGIYRMFASAKDGINAYVSPDGLKYVLEKKKVLSEGYSPRVYKIRDNRYLMVYNNAEVLSGTGDRRKLYYKSASASDGLNFNPDMSIHLTTQVLRSPNLISSPEILRLENNNLRMYYTGDLFAAEIGSSNKKIKSAISLDKGNTWMREDGTRINAEAMDPCVVALPDGGFRMFYSAYDSRESDETMSIYSAYSPDGLNYTIEGKAFSAGKEGIRFMDPRLIEINGGYRMYYTEATGPKENEKTAIRSAVYIKG
jgi:predicted GH43/DUF377 family glycosyl hydrolase